MNKIGLVKLEFKAMGTIVSADVAVNSDSEKKRAEEALESVQKIFQENEKRFSRFTNDSELIKINQNTGKTVSISDSMAEILNLCLEFNAKYPLFDPRIIGNLEKIGYRKDFEKHNFNQPAVENDKLESFNRLLKDDLKLNLQEKKVQLEKRIDLGGIAKGFTADKAVAFLQQEKFDNFIIDAGGDIYAQGLNETAELWKIDIEGIAMGKILLGLSGEAVATSGIGKRRWKSGEQKVHHLLNPFQPDKFSPDLKSVTAVAEKTVLADVLAKTLFILGREEGLKEAQDKKIKAIFLDYKGNAYISDEIKKNIL